MSVARVLVVENDRRVRTSLGMVLEHEGYEPALAASGEAALDSVRVTKPDLLVLDLNLPGMDGTAVCRQLRMLRYGLPILMLTARHTVRDRVSGPDAGADDYLV